MRVFKGLLYGLVAFIITYLLNSFSEADLNIANWSDTVRDNCAGVGGIAFSCSLVIYILYKDATK